MTISYKTAKNVQNYQLIVIGVSRGGLNALQTILSELNRDFRLPIAIVQHREAGAESNLTAILQQSLTLPVKEVEDKDEIAAGKIYLAPADYHLLVETGHFALSTEEPRRYSRPSIDILFESAAYEYRDKVIGVILTGANQDGALGLAEIACKGGLTIVQDPSSAVSREMPLAALEAVKPDYILPLEAIGAFLNRMGESK